MGRENRRCLWYSQVIIFQASTLMLSSRVLAVARSIQFACCTAAAAVSCPLKLTQQQHCRRYRRCRRCCHSTFAAANFAFASWRVAIQTSTAALLFSHSLTLYTHITLLYRTTTTAGCREHKFSLYIIAAILVSATLRCFHHKIPNVGPSYFRPTVRLVDILARSEENSGRIARSNLGERNLHRAHELRFPK